MTSSPRSSPASAPATEYESQEAKARSGRMKDHSLEEIRFKTI